MRVFQCLVAEREDVRERPAAGVMPGAKIEREERIHGGGCRMGKGRDLVRSVRRWNYIGLCQKQPEPLSEHKFGAPIQRGVEQIGRGDVRVGPAGRPALVWNISESVSDVLADVAHWLYTLRNLLSCSLISPATTPRRAPAGSNAGAARFPDQNAP